MAVHASASAAPLSAGVTVSQDIESRNAFLYDKSDVSERKTTQSGIGNFVKSISVKSKEEMDKALGRFLFSANISFNVVENQQFQDFIKPLNPAYTVPSHDKIGSTILDEVYKEVRGTMEKQLRGTTGVLTQDGWSSIGNDAVIAHCVKSGENTHLLSTAKPSTEKAGAEYCYDQVQAAIDQAKSEFDCDIVALVTDNCSTMAALQQLIAKNYPELITIGCNSHLFNLLGCNFTPADLKKDINFVQNFMKSHHFTVAALKKRKCSMPVLPGNTRWNSQIDSFLNYMKNYTDYLSIAREMKSRGTDKKTKEKLDRILKVLSN